MPTRYPVAVFAYSRPDLLARTLEPLRAAGVPTLYAYVDGVASPHDAQAQAAVVAMLKGIDWTAVKLTVRPQNLGLHAALRTGLSEFFAAEPVGIVLEEDVRLAVGAYDWLCAALDRYADDPTVGPVAAWNHPRVTPASVAAPYWCLRWSVWGWGAHRRAWALMSEPVDALLQRLPREGIDPAAYGDDVVTCARDGQWDAHWALALYGAKMRTLYPPRSLADHIGFGASATNQHQEGQWRAAPAAPLQAHWPWPEARTEPPEVAELWRRASQADAAPLLRAPGASARRRAAIAWHRLTRAGSRWPQALVLRLALWAFRRRGGRPFDDSAPHVTTPIRFLWQRYLLRQRDAFFGRGIEIGDAATLRAVGGAHMTACEVLDRIAAPGVDHTCDLQQAWSLPENAFQVFVNQFTIHILQDDRAALWHCIRALREDGTLFVSFPCAASAPPDGERYGHTHSTVWRMYTMPGVRALLDELGLDEDHAELEALGGADARAAYLLGVPAEAMDHQALRRVDPDAPLLIAARITKPVGWAPKWSPTR